MSSLFDDVSRVIGSSVSRRKMLGMVGGAVGGAVFASLGLRAAAFGAQSPQTAKKCPPDKTACGTNCCDPHQVCVDGEICCPPGHISCNGKCCGGTCTNGLCCGKNYTYCGGVCCPDGIVCCNGKCCGSTNAVCFNGKCCGSGIICNGVCCDPNEICCDGKRCVDKHESPIKC
jgi:hypothetical protein